MHIYQHIQHYQHENSTTHYTFLSHHCFSHETQIVSLPECGNPIPKYVATWQSDLILCQNMATRSKFMSERGNWSQLACWNVAIRSSFTHHNHNHKYIIKIIHLHHDFMDTSFITTSVINIATLTIITYLETSLKL